MVNKKRRIHDGIAGSIVTLGVLLSYYTDPIWLAIPGLLGVTLMQSMFTGFCPVYFLLDKLGIENNIYSKNLH